MRLYKLLKARHGNPRGQWSVWANRPKTNREKEQIIIEAILTQRTNWRNVERAMANLKRAGAASINGSRRLSQKDWRRFENLIKPAGFYKQKAGYLWNLIDFIKTKYGSISKMAEEPIHKLRAELLSVKGVGPETADSILLYALEKPVFVIDEYTRRLLSLKLSAKGRYLPVRQEGASGGKIQKSKYEDLRELFEASLPRNFKLYQDFHALIVIDGKNKN